MITELLARPWLTASAVLTALVGIFLFRRIQLVIKLRHFKGPLLNRISGIPFILALLRDDHDGYCELIEKYGPVVVVAPSVLFTSSPDLWARSNTHTGWTKSKWYYRAVRFDWRRDNVFTETNTANHDKKRKKMVKAYTGSENLTLEADLDTCVIKLIDLIRTRYSGQKKPMDLAQKVQFLTLDVISTIGFGKCFGLMDMDEDPDEYLSSTHAGLIANRRQLALGSWWTNHIPFYGPRGNPDASTAKGFEKMIALNASMVETREKEFNAMKSDGGVVPKADMLTSFMRHGLSGAELKTENVLQIVAGSDTTAAVVRGAMLYVLTNPRVYKTLQAEIDGAIVSGRAPKAPVTIRYAQSRELPYLQAVIRETIRYMSPVDNTLSRDSPPEGDTITIDGEEIFIPGGVSVIPSFISMHRNKKVYGEDADVEVFRPERWLEEKNEERLEKMKHENDLAFGHGRWLCLGKGIAMRESSNVLFELLRNFDWTIINPAAPWKDEITMGLHSISDMWVQVEDRDHL